MVAVPEQIRPSLVSLSMGHWSTRRRLQLVFAAVLALAAGAYFWCYIDFYSRYPADDAYIHFRIARNVVQTGRPYYNVDQAVLGSSSVLWTALISGMFAVFGARPEVVPLVEVVFTMAVFVLCAVILFRRLSIVAALAAAFLIVTVFLLHVSAELMETPAAVLFFLAALCCLRQNWFAGAGLFSALAVLVRYECALWLLVGFLVAPDANSRKRYVVGSALPLLLLIIFDLYFFGTLVPNTVYAKARLYQLSLGESVRHLGLDGWEIVPFAAGTLLLVYAAFERGTPSWARGAAIFPLLLVGAYAVTRTFVFDWYVPLVLLPLVLSACVMTQRRKMVYALLLLLLACHEFPTAAVREGYGLGARNPGLYRDYETGARLRQYLRIGTDLFALFPQAVLMTSEIGGLGWTFRGRIIDAAGLISPECLKYHPMRVPEERSSGIIGAIPPRAVRDLAPELVVSMETFSEAFRRDLRTGQIENYRLFKNYPVLDEADSARSGIRTLWGSRFTQVYLRQP